MLTRSQEGNYPRNQFPIRSTTLAVKGLAGTKVYFESCPIIFSPADLSVTEALFPFADQTTAIRCQSLLNFHSIIAPLNGVEKNAT